MEAPLPPSLRAALEIEGDPEAGSDTWRTCAVCHGDDGAGSTDGSFPQIAGQHRTVLVKQLVDIREGRRRNPVMEPFARHLIDAGEIADVSAHLGKLPIPHGNGVGEGDDLEAGGQLYTRDCAGCHGDRGQGDAGRFVPVVAGQHYAYLLRQMRAIAAGRRANAHPLRVGAAVDSSDAELRATADHLSRLEWPDPKAGR